MIPYVPLDTLRARFEVIDPDARMEWEMTHHCEQ